MLRHINSNNQDNRFGTRTPGAQRVQTNGGINSVSRKVNRTDGLKTPRTFAIYRDEENLITRERGEADGTKGLQQKILPDSNNGTLSEKPPRSLPRKQLNPLADKTNTVKKSRSRNFITVSQSPTPTKPGSKTTSKKLNPILKSSINSKSPKDRIQSTTTTTTPHLKKSVRLQPPNWNGFNNEPDSVQRLLYRTPVTSKRARRPPAAIPFDSSMDISEDVDDLSGENSFGYSERPASFPFSLSSSDVPEVEYGPPTATAEQIEVPGESYDFLEFFKSLKNPGGHMRLLSVIDESSNEIEHLVRVIMEEDGQKQDWIPEPIPKIDDKLSECDSLFDELFFSSYEKQQPIRQNPIGGTVRSMRSLKGFSNSISSSFHKNSVSNSRSNLGSIKNNQLPSSSSLINSRNTTSRIQSSSGSKMKVNSDKRFQRITRSTILDSEFFKNPGSTKASRSTSTSNASSSTRTMRRSINWKKSSSPINNSSIRRDYRESIIKDLIKFKLEAEKNEILDLTSLTKQLKIEDNDEHLDDDEEKISGLSYLNEFRFDI